MLTIAAKKHTKLDIAFLPNSKIFAEFTVFLSFVPNILARIVVSFHTILTLFRMGFFGAAHGWRASKKNYNVNVVMRTKFGNSDISVREVNITSIL